MIRAAVIALFASATIVMADSSADSLTRAGIVEFDAAYREWSGERFANAAGHFRKASNAAPRSAVHKYWLGTALFHRMLQLQSQSNAKQHARSADTAMEGAITALEAAVAIDPHHAESHALLGTLYGMKIKGGMLRAIRFGPRVQDHQKHALKNGANNPRVQYLLGTARFHTAKEAADYRVALKTLLDAEKLFVAEAKTPRSPLAPRWGLSSCRTFIGRTHLHLGDRQNAAAYFRKALADHPADHVARQELSKLSH